MTLTFAAFDVETVNPARGSICSVGIAIVRDGVLVRTESLPCRPPAAVGSFAPFNVRIHRITPAVVAGEPTFAQRLPRIRELVGGVPLPRWTYGCSLGWAKRQLVLADYKLGTVAAALGVQLDRHHEAGADATAAAEVTVALARLTRVGTIEDLARVNGKPFCLLGGVRG
ncbi:exonuclease domain-containing protein [Nocardia thailandica]